MSATASTASAALRPQAPLVWAALVIWALLLVLPVLLVNVLSAEEVEQLSTNPVCTAEAAGGPVWFLPALPTVLFLAVAAGMYGLVRRADRSVEAQRIRVGGLKWLMITTTAIGLAVLTSGDVLDGCQRLSLMFSIMGLGWACSGAGAVVLHLAGMLLDPPTPAAASDQPQ